MLSKRPSMATKKGSVKKNHCIPINIIEKLRADLERQQSEREDLRCQTCGRDFQCRCNNNDSQK